MKLNGKSLTPLYQQVLGDLKAQIISGAYRAVDKLPCEAELSARYSVSRVTVRRALDFAATAAARACGTEGSWGHGAPVA